MLVIEDAEFEDADATTGLPELTLDLWLSPSELL